MATNKNGDEFPFVRLWPSPPVTIAASVSTGMLGARIFPIPKEGDTVRVRSCKQWPDLDGLEGTVARLYIEEDDVWFIDFPPYPSKPNGSSATLSRSEFEVTQHASREPARAPEAPCPVPTCAKPNDVGVRTCWNCGGVL